jgi:hypothetical protein
VGSESAIRSVADRDPEAEGANVTLTVQLAPAARVEPQLVVWLKSAALVPVSEIEMPVNEVVPMFVSVTTWAALLVPTFWLPNVRVVGVTFTPVAVPVRDTVCGFPGALSLIETDAVFDPAELGRNVTLIVQLAPAARLAAQVVVCRKSELLTPVKVTPPIVMRRLPLLVSVMVRVALLVFTVWIANASDVGDKLAIGLVPVPESVTPWGLPLALSNTESVAVRADAAVGVKVTLMEQLAPGVKVVPHVVVRLKSPAFAPVMLILLMVKVPTPTFERVTLCAALEVLTDWLPNDREDGFSDTTGTAVLLKLPAVTFAPFTVTLRLVGLKLYPELLGVIV